MNDSRRKRRTTGFHIMTFWQSTSRRSRICRRLAASFLLFAVVLCAGFAYLPRTANHSLLQKQGESIIAEVEWHMTLTGNYPDSLSDIGIAPRDTKYGPWEYERRESTTRFVESASGSYLTRGLPHDSYSLRLSTKQLPRSIWRPYFTLSWSSDWPKWRVSEDAC